MFILIAVILPILAASSLGGADPLVQEAADRQVQAAKERAIPFVQENYPNDPEMLLAAALIADNQDSLPLIKRVAETMNYPPAWAAYFTRLEKPSYARVGNQGANPMIPETVAEAQQYMSESGEPDRLDPEAVAPILDVLHSWQAADPENGLPLALETNYLYGLHQDSEALDRWEQAAKLPVAKTHSSETAQAAVTLLSRLGVPQWRAVLVAVSPPVMDMSTGANLRQCARIAQYEGYEASLDGRSQDAVRWWRSTSDFGHNMQESADTIIEFLVGLAIEGIGTSPTWKWWRDETTGIPDGPIQKGRFFFGDRHDLYVEQVGAAADAALRDRMVVGKVRSQLIRDYFQRLPLEDTAQMVRTLTQPGGEMAAAIKAIGPAWANPTIPPDSWRVEYPPKKPPS